MYDEITFDEALRNNLKVMDATAFALCREQGLPIKVFTILKLRHGPETMFSAHVRTRFQFNAALSSAGLNHSAGEQRGFTGRGHAFGKTKFTSSRRCGYQENDS